MKSSQLRLELLHRNHNPNQCSGMVSCNHRCIRRRQRDPSDHVGYDCHEGDRVVKDGHVMNQRCIRSQKLEQHCIRSQKQEQRCNHSQKLEPHCNRNLQTDERVS